MKRICFVDFDMSVTGGVEQVCASLANEFCRSYEVYMLSVNGRGSQPAYQLDDKVRYTACFEGSMRLRELMSRMFRPFVRYLKKHRIDVVILMGNFPALVAGPAKFATRARFIYCDHGALMNQWHQKDITFIRWLDTRLSHRTVVLTEQTKNDYEKKFHMSSKKVECIYNWIEESVLEAAARQYNVDSKKILTVGRFGPEKGYDMLVEAADKVLRQCPDWEWHLFGTGETFEDVRQRVRELGLEKRIIFHGNVQEAYHYYKEYALFVMPSYREGLPLVLLEAKANHLPIVSFDIMTGPREMVRDGVNGYLIEPYCLKEMEDKLLTLMNDRQLRETMAHKAGLDMGKFAKETVLQKWIRLIDTV